MVMKNILKISGVLLIAGNIAACSNLGIVGPEEPANQESERIALSVKASQGTLTRASFDSSTGLAKWGAGESIGVVAALGNNFTESFLQQFEGANTSSSAGASFSGSLIGSDPGTYRLYAISPYISGTPSSNPALSLPMVQYPEAEGWDLACDYMLGQSVAQVCASNVGDATAPISFSHKVGWLKLSFAGFSDSATEKVQYVRISSNTAMAGDFTANLINQTITVSSTADKFIIADFSSKNIALQDLNAYITLFPVTNIDIDIAVKTTGHYIQCHRTGLTVNAGDMVSATVNKKTGDYEDTDQSRICGTMPSMCSKTDQTQKLNVLLLGHSFGIDATEYVPDLFAADGITNVNLCRFHNNDCTLDEYWDFIKCVSNKGCPQKYCWTVNNVWQETGSIRVIDKLADTKWDVIVLQQSTPDGRHGGRPDFDGCADYSTYQPYLSLIMEYIYCSQQIYQNNTPYLAWNMIRSYKANYITVYNQIVTATKAMSEETGISHIIAPGTAMMKAREEYTGSEEFQNLDLGYRLLTRDNWHASLGIGRYVEACTWFEMLFKPIYASGNVDITVVGNTFRPTQSSFTQDVVDDTKALTLQNIAVATAADPYNEAQ